MLLGDIGGFSGILFSAGSVIIGLFTHNNSQNYLTRRLFTQFDHTDDKTQSTDKETQSKKLDPKEQYPFKEYLQSALPAMCATIGCLK